MACFCPYIPNTCIFIPFCLRFQLAQVNGYISLCLKSPQKNNWYRHIQVLALTIAHPYKRLLYPPSSTIRDGQHHPLLLWWVESPDYTNITGLSYFIGVSIGSVFFITIMVIASYYCNHSVSPSPSQPQQRLSNRSLVDHSISMKVGLDKATLHSYPKLLYSEAKLHDKQSTTSCCSICLADYNSTDILQLLPDCGHLFHLECVDPWLQLHTTCPICRSSPLPTPLVTPQAEVVPLSIRIV